MAVVQEDQELVDLPVYRPSDTWFGPSTIEGELGYALRTKLKTDPNRLHLRPHRAVTRISVDNRGRTPLAIERLRLPMADLSLYAGASALWTAEVLLTRAEDDDTAAVGIGEAPAEAGPLTRVAGPRQEPRKDLLLRAFNSLFSGDDSR